MERVLFLALLAVIVAFCYAQSDPNSYGSGSDTLIISPSTKKPSMDSTDDSGSGVDDEDDDDVEDDTTDISTTFETTRESTTTEQTTEATTTKATTTTTQTTTIAETTTDYSPTTSSGSGPDTDYEDEGSGYSGSGDVKIIYSTPKYETTTDIYIHESTTSDDGLIFARTDRRKTTEKPSSKSNIIFKTTAKPDSTVESTAAKSSEPIKTVETRKTSPSTTETPSTKAPTTKIPSTTKPTTKYDRSTQKLAEKTTPRDSIIQKTPSTAPDANTISVMPKTTDPRTYEDTTTPWDDEGDIMAHPKDDKDGFTLTTEVIAGVVGCAVLALLLIAFLMYRLKKKDEGSYLLDESNADEYKKAHDKEAFI